MTTDAAGNLYVTDIGGDRRTGRGDIKVFPKGSTEYSRLIVPADWVPFDIAVGHDGTLYVANIAPIGYFNPGPSNTIYVSYNGTGGSGDGTINVYAESDGRLVQQISVPNGAMFEAFNKSRGKLFVSDFSKVEIYSYPGGSLIGSVNKSGWGRYNYPTGVAYWPPPQ
jgi:sugar lactone lactonase YvrE